MAISCSRQERILGRPSSPAAARRPAASVGVGQLPASDGLSRAWRSNPVQGNVVTEPPRGGTIQPSHRHPIGYPPW